MRTPRPRMLVGLTLVAALAGPAVGQTPTNTWNTGVSGSWSVVGNWSGGAAPPSGGNASRVLQFGDFGGSYSVTNDLGNPFLLNGMIFSGSPFSSGSVGVSGSPLRFVTNGSTGPFVNLTGSTFAYFGANAELASTLTVGGAGTGQLYVQGVLSGTGGLTLAGAGTTYLVAANTYSGTTTVNGGFLQFDTEAALGSASSAVVIGGGSATGSAVGLRAGSSAGATLTRAVTTATAGLFATLDGGFGSTGLTVSGPVGGAGGLTVTGNVTLAGTNTYAGPTRVGNGSFNSTVLTVSSDANLGAAGATLVLNGGTLRLAGDLSTARAINVAPGSGSGGSGGTIDTGGFTLTAGGGVTGGSSSFGGGLTKLGAGALDLTAAGAFAGPVTVSAGELRLSGAGSLAATNYTVSPGALLALDNSAANGADRVLDSAGIFLSGGELRFAGNGSAASAETVGFLSAGSGGSGSVGTVTVVPGAGQAATLTASGLSASGGLLVRGAGLGTAGGARLLVTSAPFLTGSGAAGTPAVGVLAGAVGDTTATGLGSTLLTHDTASGVRPLAAGEYAAVFGGTAQNVRLSTAVTGLNAPTAATSLTLAAGGGVAGTGTLTVDSGLVFATGAGTTVNTGRLVLGNGFAFAPGVFGAGGGADLTVAAPVELATGSASLLKMGAGTVTLNGPVTATTFSGAAPVSGVSVAAGTLRLGAAAALPNAAVGVNAGATLDLNGSSKQFASLSGSGTVQLGSGTLTLATPAGSFASGSTFAGSLAGAGGLTVAAPVALTGASSYTGATTVAAAGALTLSGAGRAAGSSAVDVFGSLTLDNSAQNRSDRLGAGAAVTLTGGYLGLTGNPLADAAQSVGTLALGAGGSTVAVTAATGRVTALTAANLSRTPTSTADFALSNAFGSGSPTGRVFLTAAPTLTGNVLPYATVNGFSFATYSAGTGVRELAFGETSAFAPGTTGAANAVLSGSAFASSATQVNSLTLQAFSGATLSGTGTVTVTSGGVLAVYGATVATPLAFGPATGYLHAYAPLAVTGPVSGSGGLVVAGDSVVTLSGANTYTGATTLNGGTTRVTASVLSGAAGPLGNSSTAVVLAGSAPQFAFGTVARTELALGAGATQFARPLTVAAGGDPAAFVATVSGAATPASATFGGAVTLNRGLAVAAPPTNAANTGFTFSNVVSGPGGLALTRGTTVLSGANTYAGGTVLGPPPGPSSGSADAVAVGVGNDAAFGSGPVTLTASSATVRAVGGPRTVANPLALGTGNFSGHRLAVDGSNDLTFAGPAAVRGGLEVAVTNTGATTFAGPLSGSSSVLLTKTETGALSLTAASPNFAGVVAVDAGTLRLGGAGALPGATTLSVGADGVLLLDNAAANVAGRLNPAASLSVSGGEVRLTGSAAGTTADGVGFLSPAGAPTLTVAAGAGQSAALTVDNGSSVGTAPLLIRGTNLGSPASANVGRVLFGTFDPFLVGGSGAAGTTTVSVLPNTVGDTSATGLGSTVVTYDPVRGVRPLDPGEYAGAVVSGTTTDDNVRLTAPVALAGPTGVTSLTLGAGGGVTGAGTLTVASGVVVADGTNSGLNPAAVNAGSVGALTFAATPGTTLAVGAAIQDVAAVAKFGAGTVVLDGPVTGATTVFDLSVAGGTLRLGAAPVFPAATAQVKRGATLDLNGNSKTFSGLTGAGTVQLGAGTLTLGSTASTPFGGDVAGTGGLTVAGGYRRFTGVSTYTGATTVARGAGLALADGGALAGTSQLTVAGDVFLAATRRANALGTGGAAVTFAAGTLTVDGGSDQAGALTVGAGQSTLAFTNPGAVNAASLARSAGVRGTLQVAGTGAVTLTTAPTLAGTGAAGTPGAGVLPYVAAQTTYPFGSTGLGLVTVEAGVGLRPLSAAEYAPLSTATATQNALAQSPTTLAAPKTVQSLAVVGFGSTVTGTSTLTVSSGAVAAAGQPVVSAPVAFGAEAVVHVGAPSQFSGDQLTLSGAVTGSDGLTKAGSGVLVLSGAAAVGGPVTVNAGTLRVDGAGNLTTTGASVLRGATLAGTGRVTGPVTVANGATVNPGVGEFTSPVGTLSVTGDVTLAGTFRVNASGSAADRLAVTGAVVIADGSVLDLSGSVFSPTTEYTLVTATGGRTGEFTTVTGLFTTELQLVYTPNAVLLAPVPEPAHVLLVAAAACAAGRWRRRGRAGVAVVAFS